MIINWGNGGTPGVSIWDWASAPSAVLGTGTGTDSEDPTPSDDLLHSPADILRHLLVDLGAGVLPEDGTKTNWPISEGQELNAPDNAVCTYDTEGFDFGRAQVTGQRFEHYGVMLRVRSKVERVGWVKARSLCTIMDQEVYQETVVIDGSTYFVHAISRKSRPIYNGEEPGSSRHVHTINVSINVHMLV